MNVELLVKLINNSWRKRKRNHECDIHRSQIHSIGNEQSGHSIKVCVSVHVALRMLLALSQPVNCIFWPIRTLNWLFGASKLHKHRGTCCTAEWPYCPVAILCPDTELYWFSYTVTLIFSSYTGCIKKTEQTWNRSPAL